MNYWNQIPLFRLLPAFVSGILTGVFVVTIQPSWIILLSIVPACILFAQVLFPGKFYRYRSRWIFGFVTHVLVFLFACLLTVLKTEINFPHHFSKQKNVSMYMAYLDDRKQEKNKSFKASVRIVSVKSDEKWINADGRCLVYLSKDSFSAKLQYGDLIVFASDPDEVKPPANPSQFDYKKWLSFNQVYHQLFLKPGTWSVVSRHHGNAAVEMAIHMRERLLKIFKDNNISGDDYAVVSALLLGDTDEIDPEIMSAYAASGALHVLSVSGLHVGIIYLALNSMLFFLERNRRTKIVKAGILILFLWFYALLTGLSPAVLRSAAMLSFIVVGKSLDRSTNMYNTLAASAMTLFLFQPHLLMQVGFQLSYLAVLGIVFLYKKIHALWDPEKWLWKQIWGLTAVSIAAQLSTFPLGLLYFQQFPNYFLLSNLLVIPVSTVIIYGGVLLFILSPFAVVANWTGLLLGKIVFVLNWIVISIEHLPFALTQGISIDKKETCFIYVFIFMLTLFFFRKEVKYLVYSLLALLLFLSSQVMESIHIKNQKQLVVFSVQGSSALNLIDGNSGIFISDSSLVNSRQKISFNVLHYWWDCGVDESSIRKVILPIEKIILKNKTLMVYRNFLMFHNKTILLLDNKHLLQNETKIFPGIDYLLLSKNLQIHLQDVVKKIRFKELIIDSSNSRIQVERWRKEATELGIACYSVSGSGAYIGTIHSEF